MKVSDKHIDFIENSLKFYGVKNITLKEDLVDHICTYIENEDSEDFDTLYQEALQKFGGYSSFQNLQLEVNKKSEIEDKFNQDIGSWNTGAVTDMNKMVDNVINNVKVNSGKVTRKIKHQLNKALRGYNFEAKRKMLSMSVQKAIDYSLDKNLVDNK